VDIQKSRWLHLLGVNGSWLSSIAQKFFLSQAAFVYYVMMVERNVEPGERKKELQGHFLV
jgi:hypothetical protein